MKRKKYFVHCVILAIMLCFVCAGALVSCSRDEVESISVHGPSEILVGNFDYSDFTVEAVSKAGNKTEVPLEKSMLSSEDNIKFFTSGTHTLTATYSKKTCEFTLKVCLYEFEDLHFANSVIDEGTGERVISAVYTGKSVTAEVFDNYPEGTVVYYKNGNSFVNAGSYEVTAIVSRKDYVTKTLTATVKIAKAKYDMSAVEFVGDSVVYDGKEHSIAVSGSLPEGVSVKYVDKSGADGANKKTNAGTYKVTARFSGDGANYEQIEDMEATLTIEKKQYDSSKITFVGDTVTYDGKAHTIEASGLPSGVSVSYTVEKEKGLDEYEDIDGTQISDAGTYRFTANFKSGDANYETIAPMTARLVIEPAVFDVASSGLVLDSMEVDYDGKGHTITIPTLPKGWKEHSHSFTNAKGEILYVDNDKEGEYVQEVSDCGTYKYELSLIYENDNYMGVELTATLTINKLKYDTSKLTVACEEKDGVMRAVLDNVPKGLVVTEKGIVEEKTLEYDIKYFEEMPNDKKDNYIKDGDDAATSVSNAGEYYVTIEFIGQDTTNYEILPAIVTKFIATTSTESV